MFSRKKQVEDLLFFGLSFSLMLTMPLSSQFFGFQNTLHYSKHFFMAVKSLFDCMNPLVFLASLRKNTNP